jgi:hypothetical protein
LRQHFDDPPGDVRPRWVRVVAAVGVVAHGRTSTRDESDKHFNVDRERIKREGNIIKKRWF